MTNQETRQYHIAFGLHSRIPFCCVLFFADEWDGQGAYRQNPLYHRALAATNAQYVMCPPCLASGNKIKLQLCRVECGGDHADDFIPKDEAVNVY